ncbi:hypothetical protein ACIHFE_23780 [Streptomyces sp. NPDC052396]|uniref:hypothetical protein n=1 Tax=Streptomyces sp. NPDC052396 TaxID=3365689 RepID=UPI0037D5B43B
MAVKQAGGAAAPGVPEAVLDLTAATAGALAEVRAARHGRSGRSGRLRPAGIWQALLALTAVVVVAAGVLRLAPAAGRAVGAPAASGTVLALTTGTGAMLLAVLLWTATWLGPVLLTGYEVTWLLPLPGDRGRLLRPRLLTGLAVAAGAGLCGAVPLAAAAGAATGTASLATVAVAVPVAVAVALLAAGAGVLTQARPDRSCRVRAAAAALGVLGAGAAAASASCPALGGALAVSGPWGWAGWAVAEAARSHPWPAVAAAAVLVAGAVGLTAYAGRLLADLPAAELAARARHGSRAGQGAALLEVRGIALVAQSVARAGRGRARFSPRVWVALRLPGGGAWPVLLWRDAVALLRRPARIAAAAGCSAAGVLLLHLMRRWGQSPHHAAVSAPQAALLGWALVMPLYLAASALSEGARQDTDNLTRTRLLPFAPRTVALSHFAVPTAVLCPLGPAVAWATARLAGLPAADWQPWALVSTVGAPAAVGAALMTAYRGAMRYDLMFASLDWYGVLPFLLWYTAPVLLCTVVAAPLLWQGVVSPYAPLGPAVVRLAVAAVVALGLSGWRVGAQARALTRTTAGERVTP